MDKRRILKPGRNCWCIEHAERVTFLIDGSDYFKALYKTIIRAQHSIQILAWDIDSRFTLIRDDSLNSQWPSKLGELLKAVVKNHRKLRAYILDWDFAMIYASAREFLPIYKFDWKSNRRLKFRLDDCHPLGASQHQKVVVIDNAVAFVGGLDITRGRWDTPEHRPFDSRRSDNDDTPPRPYHDVQMAVSGDAAAALGELAKRRWARTGFHITTSSRPTNDPWPQDLYPDLTDVEVAISRTEPRYLNYPEIREVEVLYLDAIAAARRLIYIENQYFTAGRIGESLAQRLEEANGPEVVILLPFKTDGWLAQNTLDVMREHLIRRLQQADRYNRLRIYYPYIPQQDDQEINLHAKVLIIDDELVRVGSANLNNRSMGLDSECDLAIEANGKSRIQNAIAGVRNRLLSEHLQVASKEVAQKVNIEESAITGIESLRSNERSLRPLPLDASLGEDVKLSSAEMIDPERPVDPNELINQFIGDSQVPSAKRRIAWWVALLLSILALSVAWRWTPLNELISIDKLYTGVTQFKELTGIPLLIMGGYIIGSVIAVPITLLVIVTVLAFGPWTGFAYALVGAIIGALVTFGFGRLLGRNTVRRLAGSRLNVLSCRLARRGLLTMIAVRIIPIAPFTVINLVAGASHIRMQDFLLGTALGMIPGITGIALFTDRIVASIKSPDPATLATLMIVIVIIGLAVFVLGHWLNSDSMTTRNAARH